MGARKIIRNIFNLSGFDFYRINSQFNPSFQLVKALECFHIDLVLDIGANTGGFGTEIRALGYHNEIISFEPLSKAYSILLDNIRKDKKWQAHERCAIGDFDGTIEINISKNSVSSSVLPILESHTLVAGDSVYTFSEIVSIFKLDSIADKYIGSKENIFLKIDTQGFEWQVIEGALNIMPKIKGIMCELSLIQLYQGQHLWKDILIRLENLGFELWAFEKGFVDPKNGRTLQFDAIFFKI